MAYRFQFRDVFAQQESLLEGVLVTLQLSGATIALGLVLGLLAAAAAVYGPRALRALSLSYVELIRNTPLIVQLFIVFFGLPSLGLKMEVLTASLVALTINLGAYTAEIVRAGLQSIPRSQIEAGLSLGLTRLQVFRHVELMPALKAVYPSLSSQFVLMMLATSVVSQISAEDLFHVGSIIQSRTFRDFEVYTVIAVLYLALSLLMRGGFAVIYRLAFGRR
jgi:polar amino acid transport system permease protein